MFLIMMLNYGGDECDFSRRLIQNWLVRAITFSPTRMSQDIKNTVASDLSTSTKTQFMSWPSQNLFHSTRTPVYPKQYFI